MLSETLCKLSKVTSAATAETLATHRAPVAGRIINECGLPEESELIEPEDVALRVGLHALDVSNPGFWDFRSNSRRRFAHGFFQYPAMMVPEMVGRVLDHVAANRGGRMHILDPFAGSGTVVTEAVARGWDVTASDVNPLAVLLCRTKAGPFLPEAVAETVAEVLSKAAHAAISETHWFPNVRKWFEPEVIDALNRLRQAITAVHDPAVRRFLWVALAETVRLTSNSRLSTVKLHIKAAQHRHPADAMSVFARVAARNLGLLEAETETLKQAGLLHCGQPVSRVTIRLADAARSDLSNGGEPPNVLVTSPPYGDNQTTMAYGQHAYLPLRWIDPSDTSITDPTMLSGPASIDTMSLGGSRRNGVARAEALTARSAAADTTLRTLANIRHDHANKVGAFLSDLDQAFDHALDVLAAESHIVVTVADRTVSDTRVPTARIVQDILAARGAATIAAIPRRLPAARRMAPRNNFASRMDTEWLLVMRLKTLSDSLDGPPT